GQGDARRDHGRGSRALPGLWVRDESRLPRASAQVRARGVRPVGNSSSLVDLHGVLLVGRDHPVRTRTTAVPTRATRARSPRMPESATLTVEGTDVVADVHAVLQKMAGFATRVRSGEWVGHTGRPLRNVVNIGIGGSDLGPAMACTALRSYSARTMQFRFVSNIDGADLIEAVHDLDSAETLFIVSS